MKFVSTKIRNFMPIADATISLGDRGLVLIQGVNKADTSAESNGAGKSSIADAISWCLYGITARGVSGDDVVREKSKGGTCVALIIKGDDGKIYDISRHRKDKTYKNQLQVGVEDATSYTSLTKGTDKLTQEVVNDILGCSYEVFKAAIYAGQEQMPDLPGLTDKHLKILVEEAAGTDVLERAYKLASQARIVADNAAHDAEYAANNAALRVTEHIERIEVTKRDAQVHADEVKAEIAGQQAEITQLEKVKEEIAKRLIAADKSGNLARIRECDAKIAAVAGEQTQLRQLDKEVADAQTNVRIQENTVASQHSAAVRLKADLVNVNARVGTPCGECGKPYCDHDLAAATQLAKTRALAGVKALNEYKIELDRVRNELQSVTERRDAFRASMTDLSQVSAQRARLEPLIANAEELERKHQRASDEIKRKQERVEALLKDDRFAPILERLNRQLKELQEAADTAQHNARMKAEEATEAQIVAKVFSPAGVRAHILDTVTPFLNDRTAKYLSILSDGNITATWQTLVKNAKGELREKFSIEVEKVGAGKSFAAISGGEKRKVRLACAMALQDMVASRATKPIELFMADEVDDALDRAGLERLMMILEEKARNCGSLFMISHNSLKDWCPNIITVTHENGASRVEDGM